MLGPAACACLGAGEAGGAPGCFEGVVYVLIAAAVGHPGGTELHNSSWWLPLI